MSGYINHDDVLAQLRGHGLIVESGLLEPVPASRKAIRCKVEGGDHEKRGWYRLHEWQIETGVFMLVGTYGIYVGDDPGTVKVDLTKRCDGCGADVGLKEKACPSCGKSAFKKREFTDEQKAAYKLRLEEDRKRQAAERAAEVDRASKWATAVWKSCVEAGTGHGYLAKKQLANAGGARIFTGNDGIRLEGAEPDDYKYLAGFAGCLVIPLCDNIGKIYGLQFIAEKKNERSGRDKTYWPAGMLVEGNYWLIGGSPKRLCLLAEGFATGMSLHEATGQPVAVAFAANNLLPVAKALNTRTKRRARLLACADDDWLQKCAECGLYTPVEISTCTHCGKPHKKANAGLSRCEELAMALDNARVFKPVFSDERPADRKGPTDFNDLHCLEGIQVVTAQYEARLNALEWCNLVSTPASAQGLRPSTTGGEGKEDLKPLLDVDEACERYALIYGAGGSMFDLQEHILVPKSDVMDVLVDHGWREWKLRQDRKVVRLSEVGFDPAGTDKTIKCNLWGGWPTRPRAGNCDMLLDLLRYLCSEEEKPDAIYHWILCWLAYPIQNPGAKMKTAIVMHGPQGAGKNMFFEAIMAIYGEYGSIVDQSAVEDKFNDWASKKLFMIADEVVARQELYHVKNKLKHFITGDKIRINPKNVAAHEEVNHVNLVFLSNETQPLVLERDDRRYAVVWTPCKLSYAFYTDVTEEIEAGGIEALHDYLLNYDIGDFKHHTNPPNTKAKRELIEQSMDSTERFWMQWNGFENENGQRISHLDGVPVIPCKSADFYDLYKAWCPRVGIAKPAAEHILMANIGKRPDCQKRIERYYVGANLKQATFLFPSVAAPMPAGTTKASWLSDCAEQFADGVKTWKGSRNVD